ncbi:hypothetical protein NDU88_012685 [Pleurodeles waltl]|uniref:Uncharacterized protein n=1 Tax=Pleurodeles waltl TaxID=8319 RepID=A0AAV7R255_PLEWA|nr:hypothetical protein NDU88_012685 [Pleurodeles waltl]
MGGSGSGGSVVAGPPSDLSPNSWISRSPTRLNRLQHSLLSQRHNRAGSHPAALLVVPETQPRWKPPCGTPCCPRDTTALDATLQHSLLSQRHNSAGSHPAALLVVPETQPRWTPPCGTPCCPRDTTALDATLQHSLLSQRHNRAGSHPAALLVVPETQPRWKPPCSTPEVPPRSSVFRTG